MVKILLALFMDIVVFATVYASSDGNTSVELRVSNEDLEFAGKLQQQAMQHSAIAIKEQYQELMALKRLNQGFSIEDAEYGQLVSKDDEEWNTKLRIFVSKSMSKNLLKSYYKEAKKYGGYLVFNGLPKGSFKELTKLVLELADDEDIGGMEIDDEAFKRYNVTRVPAIVLSQEKHYGVGQEAVEERFDRISGAISIKLALEEFISKGELSQEASKILKR